MRGIKEKIFFFDGSKNRKLLGFLHQPSKEISKPVIIYCHPFADEMNLSYRVAVDTSRILANQGFPVFRFNLSGCGDSEGEFDEVILEDWLYDIECAVECIKGMLETDKYGLWGLRLGADLALLYEMKFKAASFLILWQPVISFSTYIQKFLRRKAIFQLVGNKSDNASLTEILSSLKKEKIINVMGYPFSHRLHQSFMAIDSSHMCYKPLCQTLLISISKMENPIPQIEKYYNKLKSSNVKINFNHVVTDTFWDQYWHWESKIVTNFTSEWLQNINFDD